MPNRLVSSSAAAKLSASVTAFRQPFGDGPVPIESAALADMIAKSTEPGETLIVGVTGSVAAGKTALCSSITRHLSSTLRIETISTDGFLMPNLVLEKLGLSLRKGFPETYDTALMSGTLQRIRHGAVCVPGYCHKLYDRASELDRTIDRPDIVLVEGLGLSSGHANHIPSALVDALIYIDASEQDLEAWFLSRFMGFLREAETDPDSFYNRFRTMTELEAENFARAVWAGINLPNLRDHIAPARKHADIVLWKTLDHKLHVQPPAQAAAT